MKFGAIPVRQAEGAVLAHAVSVDGARLRKAHTLSSADIAALEAAGIDEVVAAVLDPADLGENEAAAAVAEALHTTGVEVRAAATGRVNLHATLAGLFTVDRQLVDAVNAVDPAVTLATLSSFAAVTEGQMVATVKIIPFAVPRATVDAVAASCAGVPAFEVRPFQPHRVGLIQTALPGVKASVLDKTRRATDARLARSMSGVSAELRVAHTTEATAAGIAELLDDADMLIVFGASAVSDEDDVIPAAIRLAGGTVERTGMPVDPGNLLVLGSIGEKPVIGAPGCARSPKENGFDWVLDRLTAGLAVTSRDIAGMGVGGLLMEIPTRPQPRETARSSEAGKVWAVLLAAGRSSRMAGPNKLMAHFEGTPLLRRVAERTIASKAGGTVVVTGHQAERVTGSLENLGVRYTHNPDFASGLASSLKTGIAALPPDAAGALVVLGDMPGIATGDLDRMLDAFHAAGGNMVVRATANGKRGNPVILPRSLFAAVETLEGDTGARHIVEESAAIDVELGEGAATDVDTPDALARAGGVLQD